MTAIITAQEAIEDIRQGKMIILVDDEDREKEGDITIATEFIPPEIINFMVTHGRGLVCLAMLPEYIDRLNISMMASNNGSRFETNFTVFIEAKDSISRLSQQKIDLLLF